MAYTHEQVNHLQDEHRALQEALQKLLMQCVIQGDAVTNIKAKEYMLHGAARRLRIMARALGNIYQIYPPSNTKILDRDSLTNLEINLHAYLINLYGVFENFAWSFVALHDLEAAIGGRMKIGVFCPATQKFFPEPIQSYVQETATKKWFDDYLKNYRDALAHRIPLYVPPATYTAAEAVIYKALEAEKIECFKQHRWDRIDEIWHEQDGFGVPSKMFLHSFSEHESLKPVLMHPQVLCDGMSIVEFGRVYLEHWRNRA